MKIVHVCTNDSGGAFWAAYNLHLGLLAKSLDSWILVLRKSNKNLTQVVSFLEERSAFQKIQDSIYFRLYKSKKESLLKIKPEYLYSFPFSPYNILRHEIVKSADIINLHWVRDFLDYQSFFQHCTKPIVWTLHDKNPFSGGFHFDTYYNPAFGELDRQIINIKKKALEKRNQLNIVAPSKWLLNESENSEILGDFDHYLIPNGVDTELFTSHNKTQARKELDIPLYKKIVLFVSDSVDDPRKGIQLLYDALENLDKEKFILLTVGGQKNNEKDSNYISFGFIDNKRHLSKIYSASDVFVVPSVEDNLPNTVLESLACGTPVVGFEIGGIPEMVNGKLNGLIIKDIEAKALSDGISFALGNLNIFDSKKIRSACKARFSIDLQVSKYYELYNSLFK